MDEPSAPPADAQHDLKSAVETGAAKARTFMKGHPLLGAAIGASAALTAIEIMGAMPLTLAGVGGYFAYRYYRKRKGEPAAAPSPAA